MKESLELSDFVSCCGRLSLSLGELTEKKEISRRGKELVYKIGVFTIYLHDRCWRFIKDDVVLFSVFDYEHHSADVILNTKIDEVLSGGNILYKIIINKHGDCTLFFTNNISIESFVMDTETSSVQIFMADDKQCQFPESVEVISCE